MKSIVFNCRQTFYSLGSEPFYFDTYNNNIHFPLCLKGKGDSERGQQHYTRTAVWTAVPQRHMLEFL